MLGELRQVVLFLLFGAEVENQSVHQRVLQVDEQSDARVDLRQLLDDEHGREERLARAAVLAGHVHRHELERENDTGERRAITMSVANRGK